MTDVRIPLPIRRRAAIHFFSRVVSWFLLTQFVSGSFLYFIAFEAITILIVLGIFGACLIRGERRPGSAMLALGVTLCLLAAVIDVVYPLRVTCIWEFDNHGLFHVVQMGALLPLSIGAVQSCGQPDLTTSPSPTGSRR